MLGERGINRSLAAAIHRLLPPPVRAPCKTHLQMDFSRRPC